jgi:hypothetical protein
MTDFQKTCYCNSAIGGYPNTTLYKFTIITNDKKDDEQTFGVATVQELKHMAPVLISSGLFFKIVISRQSQIMHKS